MIGQRVSLTIGCDAGVISSITWSVPGQYIKNYTADENAGTLTFLDSADLSQATIVFYWVQPGTYKVTVSFSRTQNGVTVTCDKDTTFTVVAPTVTTKYPVKIGLAQSRPESRVVLVDGDFPSVGISFQASVSDPAGFADGIWRFTQLWALSIKRKKASNGTCSELKGSTPLSLDTSLTYPTPDGQPAAPWAADGAQHYTEDSPVCGFDTALYSQITRDDAFHMYMMYKPLGSAGDSVWVAINVLSWNFSFCALPIAGGGAWNVIERSSQFAPWSAYPSNPTWTKMLPKDASWYDVDCPPLCSAPPPPPPPP